MKRAFALVLVFIMLASLLAACGGAPSPAPTAVPVPPTNAPAASTVGPSGPTTVPAKPAAAKASGKLVIAQGIDLRSMLPLDSTTQQEHNVSTQVVEKLMMYDATNKLVPNLATEWKQIDSKTLQVKLRQGVKFTNGEVFDADAAKYSMDQLIKAAAYIRYTDIFDRVDVVDKSTINIITKWAAPTLMSTLGRGSFVLPPKYFAEVGAAAFGKKPIGTGPFKFVEWVKDDHITLEANADYWGGSPLVQTVLFKPIPEPASRIAALEAGDVDLIGDVPIPSMERLQKNTNLAIFTADGMRNMKLTLDQLNPGPMKDVKVRQAMNYGVNVDEIISVVFKGQATKLNCQLLTPAYFGYNPSLKPYPYDPAKAKQLLADAGYPNGLELEFKYPTGRYAQDKEVAEALAGQLGKAGFKIKQVVMESGKFLELENQRKLGPFFFVGSLTVPDAHYQLNQSITSANYTYYSNTKYDDLIDRANKTLDEKERLALYAQATQLACEDPTHVFLYAAKDVYAGKKSVTGFAARPDQWYDLLKVAVK